MPHGSGAAHAKFARAKTSIAQTMVESDSEHNISNQPTQTDRMHREQAPLSSRDPRRELPVGVGCKSKYSALDGACGAGPSGLNAVASKRVLSGPPIPTCPPA